MDGISFALAEGELFSLLGLNGAGKTTTISMLSGLLEPTAGGVSIRGVSMGKRPLDAKKFIGVVPQEIALCPRLSASQKLFFFGRMNGMGDRYKLQGFRQSVPGMGSMFVMLSILAGASIMIEERKRWTLQRTITMPISKASYLAGKVLGRFLVGMMQFSIAIGTGLVIGLVFDINFGSSPGKMVSTMIAFVFCVSCLTLFIATFVQLEQQASGVTTLLATTLAPIGGARWRSRIHTGFHAEYRRYIALVLGHAGISFGNL